MNHNDLSLKRPDRPASRDDKYDLAEGITLLSGIQALARLPLEQRWRDQRAGLNTGGFISGYRGSPLGTYDQELWRIGGRLKALNVKFQPGVNEDLAATAVWGTQYVNLYPGAQVDGVFGIWYGKSPGVDRSGDAFQHANTAGTSPTGGVVALVGDDHASKSSSRAGQSDFQLKAAGMPLLYPSNVQEILDFGLHGIAMSRYSGCWVSIKLVTDVVETTSAVEVGAARLRIETLALPTSPPGGLHIRPNEPPLDMEARLYDHKLPAALTYARANGLNRILLAPAKPRLGIISAGKSWADVRSALTVLQLDDSDAEEAGIRLLKLGMTFPIDPQIVGEFVRGLTTVLVVEEKRSFIEEQVKAILYDQDHHGHVRVVGKQPADADAEALKPGHLPLAGELTPQIVARAIAALAGLPASEGFSLTMPGPGPIRKPNFCSGCPHNSSTVVPEGSRAMAGIGCHGMAMWLRAETTSTVTHMGAEGMFWAGQSHFTSEKHVFVNIGDGTFYHSGSLALRQAVAAHLRVTYKILFNGYVSMTGGQPHDGDVTVLRIVDIARAEGVERIAIVADDLARYEGVTLPRGIAVRPRTELDDLQRELRDFEGVSVLIYDQACATELRRQRKKDPSIDVAKRTFINPEVCEGCGDCGTKSNCMSIEPLETELGRKRKINQSSCNKDFSCVEGFCPSFVTVHGGTLKRPARTASDASGWKPLPTPALPDIRSGFNVLIAGIGGTGIVTVGAILAKAASLDGLGTSVLDLTGMAQKYGAVMSHLRIMPASSSPTSSRLGLGEADTVIGCDLIVAAGQEATSKMAAGRTFTVVNTALSPTSDFPKMPDWNPSVNDLVDRLRTRTSGELHALDASRIATALMGDAIAINMFLLGYAWQLSRVPVSEKALTKAIEMNGVQVEFNRQSFEWGRRAALDLAAVEQAASSSSPAQVIEFAPRQLQRVEEIVADRVRRLTDYQDDAYAQRYLATIRKVQQHDGALGAQGRLARCVARYYYKLLANKDEFEVARLYSAPEFRRQLDAQFGGDYKVHFHLGAWPFAIKDTHGALRKREVGPWMLRAMGVLSKLRRARGSWLDPFRNTPDRLFAHELLAQYEADLDLILDLATPDTLEQAIELAGLPEKIRGYGHVREAHASRVAVLREPLRASLQAQQAERMAA